MVVAGAFPSVGAKHLATWGVPRRAASLSGKRESAVSLGGRATGKRTGGGKKSGQAGGEMASVHRPPRFGGKDEPTLESVGAAGAFSMVTLYRAALARQSYDRT